LQVPFLTRFAFVLFPSLQEEMFTCKDQNDADRRVDDYHWIAFQLYPGESGKDDAVSSYG